MKFIESFLKGKNPDPKKCEDGFFINDDFVVVVDGVTSKGLPLKNGKTGGCEAKDLILQAFRTMPAKIDVEECLTILDDLLAQAYEELCEKKAVENYLRAAVIIYSNAKRCIWSYGDCLFAINGQVIDNSKLVDRLASELRSILICEYLSHGFSKDDLLMNDKARQEILPLLKLQQHLENLDSEFGFPVLNGHGICKKLIRSIPVPKASSEIVLASDGYPILCASLEESENELQNILKNDPLCYQLFPNTKGVQEGLYSFDDRCYIRFSV